MRSLSRSSVLLVIVVASAATALSLLSYQYSTAAANQILDLASEEVRSTTNIQSQDLAGILANKVETIASKLQLMADSSSVQRGDVQAAIPLFDSAKKSSGNLASSYFWVNGTGKLVWADAFSNKTIEQQYNGGDRSNRDYYAKPRDTLAPYYTTVIESVDGVPRLYIGYPIVTSNSTFNGVIAAAINLDTLGKFVKDQLQAGNTSNTGLLDKDGLVLYSSGSPQLLGKNIFGQEIQDLIPSDIREPFIQFIRDSLTGKSGVADFSSQGVTSTIAYRPVVVQGNEFAVLFVVTPHQLANNVVELVEQQRALNTAIIIAIAAVAAGVAALVLTWNKRLSDVVAARTSELKFANESLVQSNSLLQSSYAKLEQANRQLEEANEHLQLHDKMQTEFINIAAHELRTPTQAILGYSELLEESQPEEFGTARDAIVRNALRLRKLTGDILDVSRIEGHTLRLEKENFDMNEKIEHVIKDTKSSMKNGGMTDIVFERSEPEIQVYADSVRVSQVVSNLLGNALKFTKKGRVTIKAEKHDGRVIISIMDTGTGIHPEIMPSLFTKFATKSETGTGLGLYISKNIIEAHGGRIWADNNPDGSGATFGFSLPLSGTHSAGSL